MSEADCNFWSRVLLGHFCLARAAYRKVLIHKVGGALIRIRSCCMNTEGMMPREKRGVSMFTFIGMINLINYGGQFNK